MVNCCVAPAVPSIDVSIISIKKWSFELELVLDI
jgi:hypothetical protein